jgi:hypothetical protein
MNLPDAPIAHEGFFATHFFTVSDQDKSKDFLSEFLAGRWDRTSTTVDAMIAGVAGFNRDAHREEYRRTI